jgi:hypothetical protein
VKWVHSAKAAQHRVKRTRAWILCQSGSYQLPFLSVSLVGSRRSCRLRLPLGASFDTLRIFMEAFFNFFSQMTWQDWVTAISVIFGVISLVAYWEQKKANKQQETFYQFAKRHVDKDITEEQLKVLLSQKTSMESQITEQIPILARLAVLKEQSELHVRAIGEHYVQWEKIASEVEAKENIGSIDPKIEAIIIDRIRPQYEKQRFLETIRTRVTVLSVSMALASSILPFPISELVVYLFAVPLITALLKLFSLQDDFPHYIPWVRRTIYLIYLGLIVTFALIAFVTITGSYQSEGMRNFSMSMGALAAIMLLFSPFAKKLVDKFLENLLVNEHTPK